MEHPLIMCYGRILDNLDNAEVLGYESIKKSPIWFFGQCNAQEGGESQYIVELDIWNNEPGFKAGMYDFDCENAINCRLACWPNKKRTFENNELFNLSQPFLYARNTTFSLDEKYTGIKYNNVLSNITGQVNNTIKGVIQGNGDHAIVQTKVILPENSIVTDGRWEFNVFFIYDHV